MPELPEVETVARQLQGWVAGAQITEIPGASHAVLVSRPGQVSDVIERAAAEV